MQSPFPPRQALPHQEPASGNAHDAPGPASHPKTVTSASEPVDQRWRAIGCSVQGASHIRRGTVNQDAIGWLPADGGGRVVLAVADGHGSAKNFRSATGAKLARDVALRIASEILTPARLEPSLVKRTLEDAVPMRIVRDWLDLVQADIRESPLTATELAAVEEHGGAKNRDPVELSPVAYGSTLVTALATESFTAFWQIGDGDVLTVSDHGTVGRPVPGDERLIANETTSLCLPEAWRFFRVAMLGTQAPMILVSTDGFANSFQNDDGFFKFGSDVRRMIETDGIEAVNGKLHAWLTELTQRGSGDDISLGIVCRPEVLRRAGAARRSRQANARSGTTVAESDYPASWPLSPASETAYPASQPTMPAAEPSRPDSQPTMPAAEPSRPDSRPRFPAAEPAYVESRPRFAAAAPRHQEPETRPASPEPEPERQESPPSPGESVLQRPESPPMPPYEAGRIAERENTEGRSKTRPLPQPIPPDPEPDPQDAPDPEKPTKSRLDRFFHPKKSRDRST